MFIAPECRESMALEQAEFQSMVSGEDVSVAIKHEKAKSIQWTTPGVMADEMPDARHRRFDLRRLVTFNFVRQVKDADATLPQKLKSEVPVSTKVRRAYLDYALHKYLELGTSGTSHQVLHRRPQGDRGGYPTRQVSQLVGSYHRSRRTRAVVCLPDAFQFFARNRCGEQTSILSGIHAGLFSARITVERTTMTWGAEGRLYEDEDFAVGVTVKE